MEELINQKRDKRTMKINVLDYFSEDEIYVKHPTQKRGIKLSELRLTRPEFLQDEIKGFHIGRFGKQIHLPLNFEIDKEWFYVSELIRTDGHISKNFDRIKLTSITSSLKESFRLLFSKFGIDYSGRKKMIEY